MLHFHSTVGSLLQATLKGVFISGRQGPSNRHERHFKRITAVFTPLYSPLTRDEFYPVETTALPVSGTWTVESRFSASRAIKEEFAQSLIRQTDGISSALLMTRPFAYGMPTLALTF